MHFSVLMSIKLVESTARVPYEPNKISNNLYLYKVLEKFRYTLRL